MELEPERALSPTLTSRYMNNYLTNPSDIYHQNFHPPRQNLHSFYPVDNNNRNYLKRQYYDKDEFDGENERERKYEKLMDYPHQPYHHSSEVYDTYNNNNHLYSNNNTQEERSVADTSLLTNTNSNDNYPINSSPSSSVEEDKNTSESPKSLTNGKKTKGRVKIKMEYIENKLRRYTTFSKRKTGIMKKAYELSTLTGTQVMLLVASETGHVYTFATRKLQPMITSEAGKALIQTCLNTPELSDQSAANGSMINEQRMSATGFEETELTFDIQDMHDIPDKANKVRQLGYNAPHQNVVPPNISSHSHIYNLPHAPQHYPHSPQTAHHYSSPHYSPPSPLTSQHFQAPPVSAFPGFYENTGTSNACPPLGSYQTIRPPSATEDKSSKT